MQPEIHHSLYMKILSDAEFGGLENYLTGTFFSDASWRRIAVLLLNFLGLSEGKIDARIVFQRSYKVQIDRLPHVVVVRISIVTSEVLTATAIRKAYPQILMVLIFWGILKKSKHALVLSFHPFLLFLLPLGARVYNRSYPYQRKLEKPSSTMISFYIALV